MIDTHSTYDIKPESLPRRARAGWISKVYPTGSYLAAVVSDCADAMVIGCADVDAVEGLRLDTQHTLVGPASDQLARALKNFGLVRSIREDALYIEKGCWEV